MGNSALSGNTVKRAIEGLARKLPAGWQILPSALKRGSASHSGVDAIVTVRGPGKATGSLLVQAKSRLEPKDVDFLDVSLEPPRKRAVLIVAPFLSLRTQERLRARGFGYADLTGNIRLSLSDPGLFIETVGATLNPEPTQRDRKSLKGAKAGRLVRALCDFRPPIGLRDLAKRAGVDAGYASRVVDFLNREALVTRAKRGPITGVDWPALLRRWSQDYSPFQRQRVTWYLAPRGIAQVPEQLKKVPMPHVISGSWAAAQFAPVAPTRLLMCYANDPAETARQIGLRPTEAGANVAMVAPFDSAVFERTTQKRGVTVAALSQIAVDLLTSPGRGPNEAEALIGWMRDHEDVWRT